MTRREDEVGITDVGNGKAPQGSLSTQRKSRKGENHENEQAVHYRQQYHDSVIGRRRGRSGVGWVIHVTLGSLCGGIQQY
jgi:hypothetical protein